MKDALGHGGSRRTYPRLRACDVCPLCGDTKARGQIACMKCWNDRQPDCDDDPWAENRFRRAELALESVGTILANAMHNFTRPIIRKVRP